MQSDLYCAYLIAFLTGMCPSEIAKLRVEDVTYDGGMHFFDISDYNGADEVHVDGDKPWVNTKNGRRRMPIRQLLIDLGLLHRRDGVMKRGEAQLIPEWKVYVHRASDRIMHSHKFSKSWNHLASKVLGIKRKG